MSGRPAASFHPSPNPEDQIPQLTRGTLNLIEQAVYYAVTEALDRRLGPDLRRPAFVNEDPPSVVRKKPEKDWRPEEIGFFDPDCEEPGPVATVNCHIYYQDVYAFIDRLKDVALLRSIEKFQDILPQLLRGSALIWYSTEFSAIEKAIPRIVPLDYWYMRLIARFQHSQPTMKNRRTSNQLLEIITSSAQSQTRSFEIHYPQRQSHNATYESRQ